MGAAGSIRCCSSTGGRWAPWASSRGPKGFGVEVRPFASLADDVIRAVRSDAADLARYRGSPLGDVTMAGP
ncbi:MAG: hypothetical protein ACXWW5_08485 [Actinomycetota bacterium]